MKKHITNREPANIIHYIPIKKLPKKLQNDPILKIGKLLHSVSYIFEPTIEKIYPEPESNVGRKAYDKGLMLEICLLQRHLGFNRAQMYVHLAANILIRAALNLADNFPVPSEKTMERYWSMFSKDGILDNAYNIFSTYLVQFPEYSIDNSVIQVLTLNPLPNKGNNQRKNLTLKDQTT